MADCHVFYKIFCASNIEARIVDMFEEKSLYSSLLIAVVIGLGDLQRAF